MFMKKILCICLICLMLCGCGDNKTDDVSKLKNVPDKYNIIANENIFNVFDTIKVSDFLKVYEGKILNNKELELESIGKFSYSIELEIDDNKYKYDVNYEVKDVTNPIFISAPQTKTIEKNQAYIPCDSISFADDYDSSPDCNIEGEYDLTKIGTYNLKFVITDESGNENKKNFTLKVVDKLPSTSTTQSKPIRFDFKDIINTYKNEDTMVGIDVSKWQGDIDFNKVRDAGAEFVMMRIGVTSKPDGEIYEDKYYSQNIKNAKAAGLKVGVYFYSSATSVEDAIRHAKWIIETLDGESLDFPIAYDWENWSKFSKYEMSIHNFNKNFEEFAKVIEDAGYEVMLYSSKFYLETIWQNKNNHKVWLAHYTSNTNYEGNFIMWQRANTGRIDGINGDVDINIFYKNK